MTESVKSRLADIELAIRQDHVWIYSALESWRSSKPLWVMRNGEHFTDSAVSALGRCFDGCSKLITLDIEVP